MLTFLATGLAVLLIANLSLGDKRIDERVTTQYSAEDPQFRRNMNVLLGAQLMPGNRVAELVNGDRIFPDMLQAIAGAQKTITFETYIYWSGAVGAQFTKALAERARAGVRVHVLFDALGSQKIDEKEIAEMKAAGVQVAKYNPLRWIEVTGDVLHGEDYFPELPAAGGQQAQFFISSPGGGGETMQLMYLMSIAAAKRSILLSAAYFVPDDNEVRMLVEARKRGVRVRIIVPGKQTDSPAVRRASRSTWGRLLRAGVEIYEYQPTFYHCKVMIVDGLWVSVGSTNFDTRSFSVNDEANLNVYDREFAAAQTGVFDDDLRRSRRIGLGEWEQRPWTEKLWEHSLGLLSSQL